MRKPFGDCKGESLGGTKVRHSEMMMCEFEHIEFERGGLDEAGWFMQCLERWNLRRVGL